MLQSAADLELVTESESSSTPADGEVEDFFVFTEDVEVFLALPRRSEEGFGHLEPVSTY